MLVLVLVVMLVLMLVLCGFWSGLWFEFWNWCGCGVWYLVLGTRQSALVLVHVLLLTFSQNFESSSFCIFMCLARYCLQLASVCFLF